MGVASSRCVRATASAATGDVASNAARGVANAVASDAATGAADVAAATGDVASDTATGATRRIKAIVALYLHDEASLRVRSHLGGAAGLPSRSRSSKAQQHVVAIFLRPDLSCEGPQDLEAP